MVRPLEEPMRTCSSRRGGGSVDEEGGRLRRPGPAPARSCATPSIVLVMPVQCAPPGRGDASVPPPYRSTPAPTRLAGALQKNLPLKAGLAPTLEWCGAIARETLQSAPLGLAPALRWSGAIAREKQPRAVGTASTVLLYLYSRIDLLLRFLISLEHFP